MPCFACEEQERNVGGSTLIVPDPHHIILCCAGMCFGLTFIGGAIATMVMLPLYCKHHDCCNQPAVTYLIVETVLLIVNSILWCWLVCSCKNPGSLVQMVTAVCYRTNLVWRCWLCRDVANQRFPTEQYGADCTRCGLCVGLVHDHCVDPVVAIDHAHRVLLAQLHVLLHQVRWMCLGTVKEVNVM